MCGPAPISTVSLVLPLGITLAGMVGYTVRGAMARRGPAPYRITRGLRLLSVSAIGYASLVAIVGSVTDGLEAGLTWGLMVGLICLFWAVIIGGFVDVGRGVHHVVTKPKDLRSGHTERKAGSLSVCDANEAGSLSVPYEGA